MAVSTIYPLAATTTLDSNNLTIPFNSGVALTGTAANSGQMEFLGGAAALFVTGTMGGGTVTLQILAPNGTDWLPIGTGTTVTAVGVYGFTAPVRPIRVALTGGTAASIQCWVMSVPVY